MNIEQALINVYRAEGKVERFQSMLSANNLLKSGYSDEDVVRKTDLSQEELEKLQASLLH